VLCLISQSVDLNIALVSVQNATLQWSPICEVDEAHLSGTRSNSRRRPQVTAS
jgi:hypothetical protein